MRPKKLCVICPCFNEAEGITHFYSTLKEVLVTELGEYEHAIIFVDDCSRDETFQILRECEQQDENVRVLSFSRNFGHQIAITAGLEFADGDAIIAMDSDMQHPPNLLPELVRKWHEGADVVLAVRRQTEGASVLKNFSSSGFYTLFNYLSETKLVPGAADFYLLSRTAHQGLLQMPERHRFLRAMVAWMGFPTEIVSFDAPPRHLGTSSYTLPRMLAFAATAIFSFTSRPIRMTARFGAALSLLGIVYMTYILFRHLFLGDLVSGWASITCLIIIMGGAQLCFIGLIGEYLIRVLEEVKRRPLYLLKYQTGSHKLGHVGPELEKGSLAE